MSECLTDWLVGWQSLSVSNAFPRWVLKHQRVTYSGEVIPEAGIDNEFSSLGSFKSVRQVLMLFSQELCLSSFDSFAQPPGLNLA